MMNKIILFLALSVSAFAQSSPNNLSYVVYNSVGMFYRTGAHPDPVMVVH